MSAGWQDLLRRLRENDDLEFLKSVLHGCDACGAATPSSASLLRSRRAVARACIPGPRELVGRRVPPTGPARVACTCTQSIWASCTYGPMMDAPSALRGAGGCSSFSDRASALSAGDPSMLRTRRGGDREGPQARTSRYFCQPLRNHSLLRIHIHTHNLCDEFRVISHFYSRFRGEIECDGGDAVAVFSPLRATDAVAR